MQPQKSRVHDPPKEHDQHITQGREIQNMCFSYQTSVSASHIKRNVDTQGFQLAVWSGREVQESKDAVNEIVHMLELWAWHGGGY